MKKLEILLILSLVLGMFIGCQSSVNQQQNTDYESTAAETQESSEPTQPKEIPSEPYVFPLDAQLDEYILKGFCGLMEENFDEIGSRLSVRCYWHDGDAYVVYIDGYLEYENTATSFIVSSKEFLFPTSQPLFIYKHGIFYRFSSNNIHVLNMDAFYAYHVAQYAGLYDPQRTYEKTAINCPAFLNEEKRTVLEGALGLDKFFCTDSLWYQDDRPVSMCWYFGSHNGYDIILFECESATEGFTNISIGVNTFGHVKPFRIYAYKDGVLANLEDIYADGSISESALDEIYELYLQCIKTYLDWVDKFALVDVKILQLFCSLTATDYDEMCEQLSVRPYWESEETLVVYIEGLAEYENTVTSIYYGDMVFLFPTEQPMYLYIKALDWVYPLNWWSCSMFPGDDLNKFFEFHKEQNTDLYAPEYIYERPSLHCPAVLTAEKRTEIEQALNNKGYPCNDSLWYSDACPVSIYRYYGSDNGYDIIFYDSGSGFAVAETKEIDSVSFYHSMPFALYAYKDGVFANLEDIYAEGLISKEALEEAGNYHTLCEEFYYEWIGKINNQ